MRGHQIRSLALLANSSCMFNAMITGLLFLPHACRPGFDVYTSKPRCGRFDVVKNSLCVCEGTRISLSSPGACCWVEVCALRPGLVLWCYFVLCPHPLSHPGFICCLPTLWSPRVSRTAVINYIYHSFFYLYLDFFLPSHLFC